MINFKPLINKSDFESLKKGDIVACEFYQNVHDYPKVYRFGVFTIYENKESHHEIILQKKNNIYFNYDMYLNGDSNLKSISLIFIKP